MTEKRCSEALEDDFWRYTQVQHNCAVAKNLSCHGKGIKFLIIERIRFFQFRCLMYIGIATSAEVFEETRFIGNDIVSKSL